MNLSQIKTNARTGGVCNPEVIGEFLTRLAKCRIIDLSGEPTAVMSITKEFAKGEPGYSVLHPAEQAQRLNTISGTVTLNDALELVAKRCGGNILRPYLNYLKIGEEKFRGYSFPPDVNQSDELKKQGFELWTSEPPYEEPKYFTEYAEEEGKYSEFIDEVDDERLLEPTYIEAPAADRRAFQANDELKDRCVGLFVRGFSPSFPFALRNTKTECHFNKECHLPRCGKWHSFFL